MNAYRDQYAQLFNLGRNVVLIAISADADTTLASWAKESDFPFLLASDADLAVAKQYSAMSNRGNSASRNLFVVGTDGKIAYRAVPFREIDPTAYTELGEVIDRLMPPPDN